MSELLHDAIEMAKAEDGPKPLVWAGRVYDPSLYSPKIPSFKPNDYVFLKHYRLGVSLEDAAAAAHVTVDHAERFLRRKEVMEWLRERAEQDHIRQEWNEPAKVYQEADRLYHLDEVPKHKVEILREFWDQVAPKPGRMSDKDVSPIHIHIDTEAAKAAIERQNAIDAQVLTDDDGSKTVA